MLRRAIDRAVKPPTSPARWRFSGRYGALTCAILAVEIVIARHVHDAFVRPYIGDVLVIALVHCAVLTLCALPARVCALSVFVFACAIEGAQAMHIVDLLHVTSPVLRTVIGTSFDLHDILAYAAGTLLVLACEWAAARGARSDMYRAQRTSERAFSLLVLGLLTAYAPLSIDLYLPALTAIARSLDAQAGTVQLTLSAFMAGMGVGQLVYGPLSDRAGRLWPLLVGLALYIAAALGCTYASSIDVLIAMRFAQGLGAAAGPVIARAVVRDRYDGADVARVLSILMLVMGVAPILAPLIGGALLELGTWRLIFGALVAVGVVSVIAALATIPRRAARLPGPLANDVRTLLTDRVFMASVLAGSLGMAAVFTYVSAVPFVFMEVYHFTTREFAWAFGSNAAGFIAASQLNRPLLERTTSYRILLFATLAMCASAALLVVVVLSRPAAAWPVALAVFPCVAVGGLMVPNASALALMPHGRRAGTASSLLGAIQFAVSAFASWLVGTLNDGSALPMAEVLLGCALASLCCHTVLRSVDSR